MAKIVDGCTDSDTDPKPPWRERKETYIEHLKSADAETRLVSAADKLNNVRSILSDYREVGESIWDRFNGGREGTLWYYRALLEEFLRGKPSRLIRELELAVEELEASAKRAGSRQCGEVKLMPRQIDLIRASKLPSNMMQFAAKGALSVPPDENLEILVYLAKHNKIFGDLARMTLAGWDEKASLAAASNPKTAREVLDYLVAPENLRPKLLPALLENPSVPKASWPSLPSPHLPKESRLCCRARACGLRRAFWSVCARTHT